MASSSRGKIIVYPSISSVKRSHVGYKSNVTQVKNCILFHINNLRQATPANVSPEAFQEARRTLKDLEEAINAADKSLAALNTVDQGNTIEETFFDGEYKKLEEASETIEQALEVFG